MCDTLDGQVRELNYKTIRYLGHRDLMAFLVNELRLGERRELMKDILESAIPVTFQDVVVIFCAVTGWRKNQLVQINDARKIYSQMIDDESWSAIQVTTAAGVCTAVDMFVNGKLPDSGFVRQEQIDFDDLISNRFGQYYHTSSATKFSMNSSSEAQDDNED